MHEIYNLSGISILNGFGFSKQLKLNSDIYISNILFYIQNVWKSKFIVALFWFPFSYFFLTNN